MAGTEAAKSTQTRGSATWLVVFLLLCSAAAALWWLSRGPALPGPGSADYDRVTRHFYRGLAALQVGLIEQAKQEFTSATTVVPAEPANWANLGLAHLRLGEFDEAAAALDRAAALDSSNANIAFLRGRLETGRGQRDQGIAELRRAVTLEPRSLLARTALVQEIENAAAPGADDEAQGLMEELLTLQPSNAAVLVDRARLAAKRRDIGLFRDSVSRLSGPAKTWPIEAVEQFQAVEVASVSGDFPEASRAIAFLRNVLSSVPAFREARRLVTPSVELIADPLLTFVRLAVPTSAPSAHDGQLGYTMTPIGSAPAAGRWTAAVTMPVSNNEIAWLAADAREIRRIDRPGTRVDFPGGAAAVAPTGNGLLAIDWNHDFRIDLVAAGRGGVRLFLQSETGDFADGTPASAAGQAPLAAVGAWAADVEMDGDVDVVVGVESGAPVVLRNNGDGTWRQTTPFPGVNDARGFAWGDLDSDGDPDAVIVDVKGSLHLLSNLQGGVFESLPSPDMSAIAVSIGDLDGDGGLEIVVLAPNGQIRTAAFSSTGWRIRDMASWSPAPANVIAGSSRVLLGDFDNNGALDVLASGGASTAVWLAAEDLSLQRLSSVDSASGEVWQVADVDGDGLLDLAAITDAGVMRGTARGTKSYRFHTIRPRAQMAAGDQRINSFGIGGEVEVRAGRLAQKQTITSDVVHIGLGDRATVDVTRIVWPNGVAQAEFDPAIDRPLVAEQRLKGSCPWIFADNGQGMAFVTDFLWRSPLGLKINASDTAGVTQTEDWIRIRGDQLVARNGAYDIRMSAELWETHFVDHVSLMVVDHPADVDVFVDERFVPVAAPALALHGTSRPEPVRQAWDQAGRDVTDVVVARDGRHLGTFERGRYQGVAVDHFVEFEIAKPVSLEQPMWVVAQGWVYPTDSSINVAIGQGSHEPPQSLSLEARDVSGVWKPISKGLGFPAGKNKTVLIDLAPVAKAGLAGARRFRLRTNLEIYWDQLATATNVRDAVMKTARVAAAKADLRYRGFSVTRTERREEPETPIYERLASTTPRWRDLVGYYTRYGDVRELLDKTDDRYIIMNAGDEIRFSFPAPPPPEAGWVRDFVLVGDGWVKDGDFNTSYAKTVLPLPEHGRSDYVAPRVEPALRSDPVYRRHAADWQTFHTRFVEPKDYLAGLRFNDSGVPR